MDSPRKRQQAQKEEYARLLNEHKEAVRTEGVLMRKAIDTGSLKDVLKHAIELLDELRTSSLTPKLYYELFLDVQSQLSILETFFSSRVASGGGGHLTSVTSDGAAMDVTMHDVYLVVQHAEKLIPRLYLQITAGSVYIKCGQAGAKAVLADLLGAVSGVQHPMRGLFVRYYLAQCMRDKLPDAKPPSPLANTAAAIPSAPPNGTILDAIAFLLGLLKSMNRLWVRLGASTGGVASVLALVGAEVGSAAAASAAASGGSGGSGGGGGGHPGGAGSVPPPPPSSSHPGSGPGSGSGSKKKRTERERLELRVLLGSILSRMASLESLDLAIYTSTILPGVLDEVVQCRDRWAQAYLLEALIQVFPVDWHEATLPTLMGVMGGVVPDPAMVRVLLQGITGRMKEGGVLTDPAFPPAHPAVAAAAAGAEVASPSQAPNSQGLPHLPLLAIGTAAAAVTLPTLPAPKNPSKARAFAVFKTLLGHLEGIAGKVGGPFLPELPSLPAQVVVVEGGAPSSPAAPPPPPSSSLTLKSLHSYSVALEGLLNLLDVYATLLLWSIEMVEPNPAYVDAILGGAVGRIRSIMGLTPGIGGGKEGGALGGAAAAAAAASSPNSPDVAGIALRLTPRAVEAMRKLLEGGAAVAAAAAVSSSSTSSSSSSDALIRAMTALSSSSGAFTLSPTLKPRVYLDAPCSSAVVSLLTISGKFLGVGVLALEAYAPLMAFLAQSSKRSVADGLLASVVAAGVRVSEAGTVGRLLEAIKPVIRSSEVHPGIPEPAPLPMMLGAPSSSGNGGGGGGAQTGGGGGGGEGGFAASDATGTSAEGGLQQQQQQQSQQPYHDEPTRFAWEQGLLKDLVPLLGSGGGGGGGVGGKSGDVVAQDFAVLERVRDAFSAGGSASVIHTFPPLIARFLTLGEGVVDAPQPTSSTNAMTLTKRAVFSAVHESIRVLAVAGHIEEAVTHFCNAASHSGMDSSASQEFLGQAHIMFEELPNSSSQGPCLLRIVQASGKSSNLTTEARISLLSRALVASERVLKKGTAVEPLLTAATLLSTLPSPSSSSSSSSTTTPLIALQKALRAADASPPSDAPPLFLQCLSTALTLHATPAAKVTPTFLEELVMVCREYVAWAPRSSSNALKSSAPALAVFYGKLVEGVEKITGKKVEPLSAVSFSPLPTPASSPVAAPAAASSPKTLPTALPSPPLFSASDSASPAAAASPTPASPTPSSTLPVLAAPVEAPIVPSEPAPEAPPMFSAGDSTDI